MSVMVLLGSETKDGKVATAKRAQPCMFIHTQQLLKIEKLFFDKQRGAIVERPYQESRVGRTDDNRRIRRHGSAFPVSNLALKQFSGRVQSFQRLDAFIKIYSSVDQQLPGAAPTSAE